MSSYLHHIPVYPSIRRKYSIIREMSNHQGIENNIQKVENRSMKLYPCKLCDQQFISFQALGGHQNGHRRERLNQMQSQNVGPYDSQKSLHFCQQSMSNPYCFSDNPPTHLRNPNYPFIHNASFYRSVSHRRNAYYLPTQSDGQSFYPKRCQPYNFSSNRSSSSNLSMLPRVLPSSTSTLNPNPISDKGNNADKECENFAKLKEYFGNQTDELSNLKNPCFERGKNVCEGNEICMEWEISFDRQKYEPPNEDIMKLKKNAYIGIDASSSSVNQNISSENENNDIDDGEDEFIKWRNNFFSQIYGSTQIDEPSSEENGENYRGENVNEEDELDLELHL